MAIITVQNLKKRYGDIEAVKNISFEIQEGEISGIVGPNGAGKTTTIEIMEGFRTRDDGLVRVNGFDPAQGQKEFKEGKPYLSLHKSHAGYHDPRQRIKGYMGQPGRDHRLSGHLLLHQRQDF